MDAVRTRSLDGTEPAESRRPLGRIGLIVALTAQLVVVLDFSIVNVALPSISRQLGISSTTAQWVVTAYALTFGGLLILGGRASDLFGRRRVLVVGLVAFACASAAGGVAANLVLLVAARAVQGAAAALVAPAGLSILTTSFEEGPSRNRVLGYYGMMASVGFVAGLVAGGVLVDTVGWRGVFFVNVPVCAVLAILGSRALPAAGTASGHRHLDLLGASLVTAGMAAVVLSPTFGVSDGWRSVDFAGCLVVAAALLALFVAYERRSADPLLPMSIFHHRTLVAGDAIAGLVGAWVAAEVLVVSLYCQQVLGYSALLSGLVAIPQGLAGILRGVLAPKLLERIGVKRFLTLASVVTAVSLFLLFRFPATTHYPVLAIVLFGTGFGTTSLIYGSTVAGSGGVRSDQQGIASALINASRQIGGAVGVAVLLSLVGTGASSDAQLAASYRIGLGWAAGLAIVAALVSLAVSDRRRLGDLAPATE
jgi:EmrB/QacA subfamily drug resistance transporter